MKMTLTRSVSCLALAGSLAAPWPASAQLKLPSQKAPPAAASAPAAPAATPPAARSEAPLPSPEIAEKQNAGLQAALGWITLLDRKDWGTAWDVSGAIFHNDVPLGTWMDRIPKVREPFGEVLERVNDDPVFRTTLKGKPDGEYVTVVFSTRYANRDVLETVTTQHERDGRWRVSGYIVR